MIASLQVPALLIVLPLIGAPVCVLMRKFPNLCWALTVALTGCCCVFSIFLLLSVAETGPISYFMGGWEPPWGIEERVDGLAAFLLVLVSGMAALVAVYAKSSVEAEIPREKIALFYTLYLLCMTGLMGMTVTGDVFNLFVFLEISSLSTYALVAMGKDRRALTAAFRYLILGTVGATFYVIGIGLLYGATGTLNMADLAARLPDAERRTVISGICFIAVGVGLKTAVFPLHKWLPAAYAYAPSVVSAFVAATATKVSLYVLIRLFITVLGPLTTAQSLDTVFRPLDVLVVLAIAAMFSASLTAIFQKNVKLLLAYSSVGQLGYMLLGLSLVTVAGLTASLVHLFNHALMKGALFLAMGCIFLRLGSVRLSAMGGIAKTMPWTMAAFVIGGLSLIGVPATAGFIGKWQLVMAVFEKGWWWAALLIAASSILAVMYVWKVVEVAYFQTPEPGSVVAQAKEAPMSMLVPLWILAIANIYFGFDTQFTLGYAAEAAAALLDPAAQGPQEPIQWDHIIPGEHGPGEHGEGHSTHEDHGTDGGTH